MRIKHILLSCIVLLALQDAHAAMTVVDIKNLRRQILNYAKLVEQINNQKVQIDQIADVILKSERQLRAITGNKGVSTLLNTPSFRAPRRALPRDIQRTLTSLASGTIPTTSYEMRRGLEALLALWDVFQDYDEIPYETRQTELQKVRREELALNSINLTAADTAIDSTATNVDNIEALITEIDRTADLKHSLDLNSRIQAEAALIANQLLHIQSLQLRQSASAAITIDKASNLARLRLVEQD